MSSSAISAYVQSLGSALQSFYDTIPVRLYAANTSLKVHATVPVRRYSIVGVPYRHFPSWWSFAGQCVLVPGGFIYYHYSTRYHRSDVTRVPGNCGHFAETVNRTPGG